MVRYTLRQLEYLTETARQGGIAPASRHLNVSAAAVSSALDKLETSIGFALFDRFPAQGMRLTRAGADFAAQAADLLSQAELLDRHAADLAGERSGTIHIGTHYALAHRIVLPAILSFRERHPGIRIEVVEDDYPNLLSALDCGEIDALVVFDQGFDPRRHIVEVLKPLPPLVLLAEAHPLAVKPSLRLNDLQGIPYISVSRSGPGPSYLDLLQAAGVEPEVPLRSQSRELVQAYVGKGLGFTLVGFAPPHSKTIEGDGVLVRPIAEDIGQFDAVIARSRHVKGGTLIETFLNLCRKQI